MAFYDEDGNEVDPFAETPEPQPDPDRNPLRGQVRRLEKQVKDLTQTATEGQQAIKALEFAKAGVNLADPKASYFLAGYQGEMTADAIKAEAAIFGLVDAPTPQPPAAGLTQEELDAHKRMSEAAAGQAAPGARDFDAEMRAAETPAAMERIFAEKHAALGHTGPAIVNE